MDLGGVTYREVIVEAVGVDEFTDRYGERREA